MKDRAFSFTTLYPQVPLMPLDDGAGNIEADAQSRVGFLGWFVDLIDPLEDALVIGLGDTNPKILHAHHDGFFMDCHAYHDPLGSWRVLDSVGQQINEYLPDAVSIAIYLHLDSFFQQQMVGLGRLLHIFDDLLYQFSQMKPLHAVCQLATLHLGQIKHVAYERGQPINLGIHTGKETDSLFIIVLQEAS